MAEEQYKAYGMVFAIPHKVLENPMAHVRAFESGATRDESSTKPDYEGYLSPTVIQRYGQYMLAHQQTPEGIRASDNWQLGIPLDEYMKSLWRHFLDLWLWHRTEDPNVPDPEDIACAIIFNASGYLHELLKSSEKP